MDIVDSVINDVVLTYLNLLLVCKNLRPRSGTYIESNNQGIGCTGKRDITFNDSAGGSPDDVQMDFLVRQFFQSILQRFNRSLDVTLDDYIEFLYIIFLHFRIQVIQRNLLDVPTLSKTFQLLTFSSNLSGLLLIRGHLERITCRRNIGKTDNLNRCRWAGLCNLLSLIIKHGAYTSWINTSYVVVSLTQGSSLYQDRSNNTPSLVDTGFNNFSFCSAGGVCS